jgi:uncharacterized protein (DUF983 family)
MAATDPSPSPSKQPVLPWRATAHRRAGWPAGYWRKVCWRGLKLRCPVCGEGKLFRSYFVMNPSCPVCGVGFAREHGQWVGSLDINTFLTAFILMACVGFGPLWDVKTSLIVYVSLAIVFPIVTFRFSRGLWTAIVHLTGGVY